MSGNNKARVVAGPCVILISFLALLLVSSSEKHHKVVQQCYYGANGCNNVGHRCPFQSIFSHVMFLTCYYSPAFYPGECTLAGVKFDWKRNECKQRKDSIADNHHPQGCIYRQYAWCKNSTEYHDHENEIQNTT